jgi:hypothetical protein
VTDAITEAIDRAIGRTWPATKEERVALAIKDRRVLALEVLRLSPERMARLLDEGSRRPVEGVGDGGDRDPA